MTEKSSVYIAMYYNYYNNPCVYTACESFNAFRITAIDMLTNNWLVYAVAIRTKFLCM